MTIIDTKWLKDGWLQTIKEKPDHLSYQAFIASRIRRTSRIKGGSMLGKIRSSIMQSDKCSNRQLYRAGLEDGKKEKVRNLADVLCAVSDVGLGRAAIVQESNSHVLFKIFNCVCSQENGDRGCCEYLGGFLAGAMQACGRYKEVKVQEISCGEYPGRTCLFHASW
jgi:predicted hydrocarbon binding protein